MRAAVTIAVLVLVPGGIWVGVRALGTRGHEVTRVREPATVGGEGPGATS